MAAVFRACARLGWNEQIGNHNSLMLPGDRPLFMINPRGMLFRELTASSLIVCDLDGNVIRGKGELRKVAFHIHARIHLQNPAAKCVLHVHPQYLTALSLLEDGRMTLSHHNDLILGDRIAYDDAATGPAASNDEGDRLARALGDKTVLVMANHGVTVIGPTVLELEETVRYGGGVELLNVAPCAVSTFATGVPLTIVTQTFGLTLVWEQPDWKPTGIPLREEVPVML